MNSIQIQNILAPVVAWIASWLATKIPGIDSNTWGGFINSGIVVALGGVMGYINRKNVLISNVAAMPEVQSIKLEPSAPTSVVDATPSNVVK